jgi:hypothetical protein
VMTGTGQAGGGSRAGATAGLVIEATYVGALRRRRGRSWQGEEGEGVYIAPHICTGTKGGPVKMWAFVSGDLLPRYKCSHLYRANSCPSTNVLFVLHHNEKHICTGARGGLVQKFFSLFSILIYFKHPNF